MLKTRKQITASRSIRLVLRGETIALLREAQLSTVAGGGSVSERNVECPISQPNGCRDTNPGPVG